jgi:hypothetical protein
MQTAVLMNCRIHSLGSTSVIRLITVDVRRVKKAVLLLLLACVNGRKLDVEIFRKIDPCTRVFAYHWVVISITCNWTEFLIHQFYEGTIEICEQFVSLL